jgi:hypothetical protein
MNMPTKPESLHPNIFISYSSIDKDIVARLVDEVQKRGITVWTDYDRLIPGTLDWQLAIRDAIEACDWFLYCGSSDAMKSAFVKGELSVARLKGKSVLPVWIRGDDWAESAPLELVLSQYIDLRGSRYADGLLELIKTLGGKSPPGPPPRPGISRKWIGPLIVLLAVAGFVWMFSRQTEFFRQVATSVPSLFQTTDTARLNPTQTIPNKPTPESTSPPLPTFTSEAGAPSPTTSAEMPSAPLVRPDVSELLFSSRPHLAIATGTTYLTWADNTTGSWRAYLAVKPPGATFGDPLVIPTSGEAQSELVAPCLAVTPRGRVVLAWQQPTNSGWQIFTTYTDDASHFSEPILVSHGGDNQLPVLAVSESDGKVFIAWQGSQGNDWDIYIASSGNGGETFSKPQRVNADPVGQQVSPAIVADPQAKLTLAWSGDSSGSWRIWFTHSQVFTLTFPPEQIAASGMIDDLADQLPSLAVDPNSNVYFAWSNAYVMHPTYQVPLYLPANAYLSEAADRVSETFQVGSGYHYVSTRQTEIANAAADSLVHVVLTTYSPRDGSFVWYYRSNDQGQTFTEPVVVASSPKADDLHDPVIALGGLYEVTVAWAHQRGEQWEVQLATSTDGVNFSPIETLAGRP